MRTYRKSVPRRALPPKTTLLHIIAQKADGALRDALSIFDRIVSFSGKSITYDAVIENLNVLDYDYFFRAVDLVLTEDRAGMLLLFDEVLKKGFDEDLFLNGLAAHVRDLLVCKQPQTLKLLEVGERLRERYKQQALISPADLLLTVLSVCNECDLEFRMARNKRLHVEMSLLKMTSIRRAFKSIGRPRAADSTPPPPEDGPSHDTAQPTEGQATDEQKKSLEPATSTTVEARSETTVVTGMVGGEPAPATGEDPTQAAPAQGPTAFKTVDLAGLMAEAEQELEGPGEKDYPALNDENFKGCWDDFMAKNKGRTLTVMASQTVPALEGEEIVVRGGFSAGDGLLSR